MRESGLLALRTAEVVQLLDENGRSIRDSMTTQTNGNSARPRIRRLLVNLDAEAFVSDSKSKETSANDIYERINLVVRRNQRENNFRRILETIRSLALSQITLPSWLRDVFLGFGDPSAAVFTRLANQLRTIDFRDTFLDWDHITNSFPDKVSDNVYLRTSDSNPHFSSISRQTVERRPYRSLHMLSNSQALRRTLSYDHQKNDGERI